MRKGPMGRRLHARRERLRAVVDGAAAARGVVVGAEDHARGGVRARASRDDVLGAAAKEEAAQEVEAAVEVEVHRDRREQDDREAHGRPLDRDEPAGDGERAVQGVDQRPLRVDVGGLDVDAAGPGAQAAREVVCGATLGVGSGSPALERAKAADQLEAFGDLHGRGIIAAAQDYRSG